MSAVMTIDHMSQLVDALDRQDFPALLLERLETLVPFDLYAVFFYDGEAAPACLHSNFPPGAPERSLHRYSGGTFRYHPFFQHHLRGIESGVHFLPELCRSTFLRRPERDCDSIRLSRDEEIGYLTRDFPATLKELDLSVRLAGARTLQVGLYRHGGARFTRDEAARLDGVFPLVQSLFRRHLASWLAERECASRDGLRLAGMRGLRERLSPREAEIVGLILKGYCSKEIAQKLKIGIETVKTHRKNAYARLDVSSAPELASRFLDTLAAAACLSPPCAARPACGLPAPARSDSP
ncbi:helix-turn-helix transcriptional regulator [Achromobacter sp. Marseille-Q0513]|uniref:helix-turn-helix transcriptional regulator n=1 Tax=Achromobacter sp. Marseille-Q0513 TaxID=2829161 RepID=UPI001BA3A574|nr:helix-turn-helix transcriptional regulator [Achromobacter sp. Marseille-Q0513]MBR8653807.1 helix-turn-helix transcriptional regulator [Achromobacter sp. Marseille-Q0513]